MISFLLDEGIITVGVLSGIFTTSLLNSLKINIIDPVSEKIAPSHKLDKFFPIPFGTQDKASPRDIIRWKLFLKDFITWLILMIILYLFWKFVIYPRKINKQI